MNDGVAIDFRKLLKEEKRRSRQKQQQRLQQQKHVQSATAATTAAAIVAARGGENSNHHVETTEMNGSVVPINKEKSASKQSFSVREEDVEAIDFELLRQQEQARAARLEQEDIMARSWSIPTSIQLSLDRSGGLTTAVKLQQPYLLCQNPASIYYIPDFLPIAEDQHALREWLQQRPENLLDKNSNSRTTGGNSNGAWTEMKYAKRRVALFDASTSQQIHRQDTSGDTTSSSSNNPQSSLLFATYPVLQRLCDALVLRGIFSREQPPNHILVNEYHPGQGILPHTDGPAYLSRTATLSLGSDVLISFTKRPNYECSSSADDITVPAPNEELVCLLQPGSLLLFEDNAYLDYCHGIKDRVLMEDIPDHCLNAPPERANGISVARGYRISLTFRHKYNKVVSN